jgi:hypothetical protein
MSNCDTDSAKFRSIKKIDSIDSLDREEICLSRNIQSWSSRAGDRMRWKSRIASVKRRQTTELQRKRRNLKRKERSRKRNSELRRNQRNLWKKGAKNLHQIIVKIDLCRSKKEQQNESERGVKMQKPRTREWKKEREASQPQTISEENRTSKNQPLSPRSSNLRRPRVKKAEGERQTKTSKNPTLPISAALVTEYTIFSPDHHLR